MILDADGVFVLTGSATGIIGIGSYALNQETADMAGAAEADDRQGTAAALLDANGDGHADLASGASGENAGDGIVLVARGTATGITGVGSEGPGIGTYGVLAGVHIVDVLAP